MSRHDVVVIGGGQAGLATSALLSRRGIEHVVLERDRIASKWRHRWDSFTLVTPSWQIRLPGGEYAGDEPDGFLPRDTFVRHLEAYARSTDAPVREGVTATEVVATDGDYRVATGEGPIDARAVIVATGAWQRPVRPPLGDLAPDIRELHSHDYRNPGELPPGGVLVVGSGQSGAQLAEELARSGRDVVLATSSAGRLPRRYRGKDMMLWAHRIGFYDRRADALPSPKDRFAANAHLSGTNGGHTLNLHRFAHDGIRLAGRLTAIDGHHVTFADDLQQNLRAADKFAADLRQAIEVAIRDGRAPDMGSPDDLEDYAGLDGFDAPPLTTLDLQQAGISTVLWSSGFRWDFSWVRPAVLDDWGYPVQQRGVTASPGLGFVGMHYLDTYKSGLLIGVGEDAAHVVDHIADHLGVATPA
jgi:putative flavoprotein involved in K+ transport